jgi:hypothetical protein
MNVIEVVKKSVAKPSSKKLSERLAGSISSEQAIQLRNELTQMRNEWDRNI